MLLALWTLWPVPSLLHSVVVMQKRHSYLVNELAVFQQNWVYESRCKLELSIASIL
jgi:hypothetical protein